MSEKDVSQLVSERRSFDRRPQSGSDPDMPSVGRSQRSGEVSRIGHRGPYSLGEKVGIYGAL
nr:MAG TPA: hypothetical protein [Caudoviricetes sp.]